MLVALDHVQLAMPPGGERTGVRDLRAFVAAHALDARWSDEQPGTIRCSIDDPFGSRLELVDAG